MSPHEAAELVLPESFDDYAWEVEAKGVFRDVSLRYRDREYPLTFYEPHRLAQDVAAELELGVLYFERNLIVVEKASRDCMVAAVEELIRAGMIDGLAHR